MKLKNINMFWRVVCNFQALAVAVITHWKELFLIIENMHCIKSFKKFEVFLFCILYFDLFWNENGVLPAIAGILWVRRGKSTGNS